MHWMRVLQEFPIQNRNPDTRTESKGQSVFLISNYRAVGWERKTKTLGLAPAQDGLFALILWYVAKSIFRL